MWMVLIFLFLWIGSNLFHRAVMIPQGIYLPDNVIYIVLAVIGGIMTLYRAVQEIRQSRREL